LRAGDDDGVARALALVEEPALSPTKGNEVEEVEDPPNRPPSPSNPDEDDALDLSDRCWWDEREEAWLTDFPPPPGFDGYESRGFDEDDHDEPYERACTAEEAAVLAADAAADRAAERAEDETLRDRWFALLSAGPDTGDQAPPVAQDAGPNE